MKQTTLLSSWAILRYNNYIFNRYLPALLYLPRTTLFCERQQKGAATIFLHVWYGAAAEFEHTTSRSENRRSTNWAIDVVHALFSTQAEVEFRHIG